MHVKEARLVLNWEQNMLYTKSWQLFCRKRIFMLTSLDVSSLSFECVFYRPEHNAAKTEPDETEF